ncbi:MAG: hypothetical protein ACE5PT_04960 [Gemmatimonadales bacterium]
MRRVWHRLRPPRFWVIHHPAYASYGHGGLIDPKRGEKILAFLTERKLVRHRDVVRPTPASYQSILRVHDSKYLESLDDPANLGEILGATLRAADVSPTLELLRLHVGGTIQATRLALGTGRVAVHLGGGFHHAASDRGAGFSALNDIAVAIRRARARGFTEPVLVIDLDLHDGNGTRDLFAHDRTVHTFSIHNRSWNDDSAEGDTSVALGSDVTDEVFLETLHGWLPPVVGSVRPGLVIYVAGVDGAATDALGDWRLSGGAIAERDQFVWRLIRREPHVVPLAVTLAGGYGTAAWRYTARFLGWLASRRAMEPPDDTELILQRFRALAARWETEEDAAHRDWAFTEADLVGVSPVPEALFLGRYSRHAVELQLERLGLMSDLRARGFPDPVLSVGSAPDGVPVVRIWADASRAELIFELKARRTRRVMPDVELIEIEWLLLQDPRAAFARGRPQLPGQDHPGLGMLRDVAAWLVVVCERLGLDGIAFVPSQYYMAAVGHRQLRFVDPERQARFEGMRAALGDVPLSEANRAVNAGEIVDVRTGEVVFWAPDLMVLAVSEEMRSRVDGPEYRRALEAARRRVELRRKGCG